MRQAYLPNVDMGDWYSMQGGLVDVSKVVHYFSWVTELVVVLPSWSLLPDIKFWSSQVTFFFFQIMCVQSN